MYTFENVVLFGDTTEWRRYDEIEDELSKCVPLSLWEKFKRCCTGEDPNKMEYWAEYVQNLIEDGQNDQSKSTRS